jgi:hypothetical protein
MNDDYGLFPARLRLWHPEAIDIEFLLGDYRKLSVSDRYSLMKQRADGKSDIYRLGLEMQERTIKIASEILGRLSIPIEPLTAYADAVKRITFTLPDDPDLETLERLRVAAQAVIGAAMVRCNEMEDPTHE